MSGVIDRNLELIKLSDKVMNLAMKAYITSGNQKTIIAVRQIQDIFLDKLVKDSSAKTIKKLDADCIRDFINAKIKAKLK